MESAKDALILAQQRDLERLRTYLETLLPRIKVSEDGSSVTIHGDKKGRRQHKIQRDRWQYFNASRRINDWSIGDESACISNPDPFSDVRFDCQVLNGGEVQRISLVFGVVNHAFYTISRKDLTFSCCDFIEHSDNPLFSARMEEIKQTLRAQFERWYPSSTPVAHD